MVEQKVQSVWSPEYAIKQIADRVCYLLEPFGVEVSSRTLHDSKNLMTLSEVRMRLRRFDFRYAIDEFEVGRHGHDRSWIFWLAGIIAEKFCRDMIRWQEAHHEQEK